MKQNFTVRQGALDGVEAFLSVAQQMLAPFTATTPGVFLYYPGHRQLMPKPRAFIDHVKNRSRGQRPVSAKTA